MLQISSFKIKLLLFRVINVGCHVANQLLIDSDMLHSSDSGEEWECNGTSHHIRQLVISIIYYFIDVGLALREHKDSFTICTLHI
jgi:hypothetical protein